MRKSKGQRRALLNKRQGQEWGKGNGEGGRGALVADGGRVDQQVIIRGKGDV